MRVNQLYTILILLLSFTFANPVKAQLEVKRMLDDTVTLEIIRKGLDKSYNFEFEEANKLFKEVFKQYPHHPAYPQLMVMNQMVKLGLERNEEAIDKNWAIQYKFLQIAEKYSEALIKEDENDLEGIFFMLNTHSFLALYYSENSQKLKAVGQAQKAYKYFKKAMEYKEEYREFYFASGIYNYYVVQYPETHPVIKPFMVFFQDGDKALGLKELKIAANESVFSKTEALSYLVHIYGKYENDPATALDFSERLVNSYPQNLNFILKHIEQLIALEEFEAAEPFIEQLWEADDSTFFRLSGHLFKGLIAEKRDQNYEEAKTRYETARAMAKHLEVEEFDYPYFTLAGLARVAIHEGNEDEAKDLYKKVAKNAEYPSLVEEAETYLKEH